MDNEHADAIVNELARIADALEKLAGTVQWNVAETDNGIVVRVINHGDAEFGVKTPGS